MHRSELNKTMKISQWTSLIYLLRFDICICAFLLDMMVDVGADATAMNDDDDDDDQLPVCVDVENFFFAYNLIE